MVEGRTWTKWPGSNEVKLVSCTSTRLLSRHMHIGSGALPPLPLLLPLLLPPRMSASVLSSKIGAQEPRMASGIPA